jgi:hypothetical protein
MTKLTALSDKPSWNLTGDSIIDEWLKLKPDFVKEIFGQTKDKQHHFNE